MYKIITDYLTINKYSRCGAKMNKVLGIVIHWVANTKSTAKNNRNFFENRKLGTINPNTGKPDYGSAHEIIDLNGDIIICIPDNEVAYHAGSKTYTNRTKKELNSRPNKCTYGIECTHIDDNGKMSDATYNTLVERVADLCIKFNLNPLKHLWTHKEVVGWKNCHKWLNDNPNEWQLFKEKVKVMIDDKLKPKQNETKLLSHVDWKQESVNWLKNNKIINNDHKPDSLVTYGLFAYMMNSLIWKENIKDTILFLKQKGFIKGNHKANDILNVKYFGFMMMNYFKIENVKPLDFLKQKKFITTDKDELTNLDFGLFGAMIKNFVTNNSKFN